MITVTSNGTKQMVSKTVFDDAATQILREFETAEHVTLKTLGEIAYHYSSGTATERLLGTTVASGGHGHPYGHGPMGALGPRGPIPNGGDPAMINIQTGEFAQGWEENIGYFKGGIMTNSLVNETEHAKLLEETPDELQIGRPIVDRISHLIGPVRAQNLQQALQEIDKI